MKSEETTIYYDLKGNHHLSPESAAEANVNFRVNKVIDEGTIKLFSDEMGPPKGRDLSGPEKVNFETNKLIMNLMEKMSLTTLITKYPHVIEDIILEYYKDRGYKHTDIKSDS